MLGPETQRLIREAWDLGWNTGQIAKHLTSIFPPGDDVHESEVYDVTRQYCQDKWERTHAQ